MWYDVFWGEIEEDLNFEMHPPPQQTKILNLTYRPKEYNVYEKTFQSDNNLDISEYFTN